MTSLLKYLQNIGDLRNLESDDILEIFRKSGFKDDTKVFEQIRKKIKDDNIKITDILEDSRAVLIEEFELNTDEDKEMFFKTRDIIRKADICQRDRIEEICEDSIKDYTWDQMCHLFEQEVGKTKFDIPTSRKCYKYLEEKSITGDVFFRMGPKIKKELELSDGDKMRLDELIAKIRPDNSKGGARIKITGSKVGFIHDGEGPSEVHGDIVVGSQQKTYETQKAKK